VDALTRQLAQEKNRLTGSEKQSLNEVNADYQAVQVQTQLAADVYKTGLVSMEQARVEAYRKLKHLLVVSQPTQAEEAEYPRRLYNLATIGVLLCLFYGLIVMGLATLREHQD
ncbi:TPA: sugar transporter, partial [Aeromonas salmonicida]|nr:sugar transporter [Aeromonas salmonicida]